MKSVILLGVRGFGEKWYKLIKSKKLNIVALVDENESALKKAAKELGIDNEKCYLIENVDWNKLNADLLIDATPPFNRIKRIKEAIKSVNNTIICVKPYAIFYEEMIEFEELSKNTDINIFIAMQKRRFGPFSKIKSMIENNPELKHPRYIKIDMDMDGTAWEPGYEWRSKMPYSSLVDGAVHHFDLICWWFNCNIISSRAESWNEKGSCFYDNPNFSAIFQMSNDLIVNYQSRWTNKKSKVKHYFSDINIEFDNHIIELINGKLYYDKKYIEMDNDGYEDLDLADLNMLIYEDILLKEKSLKVENLREASEILFKTINSIRERDTSNLTYGERVEKIFLKSKVN